MMALPAVFTVPGKDIAWTDGKHLLSRPNNCASEGAAGNTTWCIIYTLTMTDAENDLLKIIEILEERSPQVLAQFILEGTSDENPLEEPLLKGYVIDRARSKIC